jgi:hypothetical protein
MDERLRSFLKASSTLVLLIVIGLLLMRQWRFAFGFLIAALWSIINFFLLLKLLKISMLQQSKAKLFLILLLKFPVLYLIGLLILVWNFFPLASLLTGFAAILLVVGVVNIWPKSL